MQNQTKKIRESIHKLHRRKHDIQRKLHTIPNNGLDDFPVKAKKRDDGVKVGVVFLLSPNKVLIAGIYVYFLYAYIVASILT